jgi:hypothetical protein
MRVRFGATDNPPCPQCKSRMCITRRTPHPVYGMEFERQTFECRSCRYEIERNADRVGEILEKSAPTLWPHDYGVLDRALKKVDEDEQRINDSIERLVK